MFGPREVYLGADVHYVMHSGHHRPAKVVRVHDECEMVNLVVFTDGADNCGPDLRVVIRRAAVQHDEPGVDKEARPDTWHWPEL